MLWGKIYFYKSKGNKRDHWETKLFLKRGRLINTLVFTLNKNVFGFKTKQKQTNTTKKKKVRRLINISLNFFVLSGKRNQQYQNNNCAPLWTGIKFRAFLKKSHSHRAEAEMSQHYTSLTNAGNFTLCCLANNYISWKDLPFIGGGKPILRRDR